MNVMVYDILRNETEQNETEEKYPVGTLNRDLCMHPRLQFLCTTAKGFVCVPCLENKPDTTYFTAFFIISGTTLVTHIITMLMSEDDKREEVTKTSIMRRFLYLERNYDDEGDKDWNPLRTFQEGKGNHFIKTHCPGNLCENWLLRDKAKFVVVMRNPKDTLAALFHFYKGIDGRCDLHV